MECGQCHAKVSRFDVRCRSCGASPAAPSVSAQLEVLEMDPTASTDPFERIHRAAVPRSFLGELATNALDGALSAASTVGSITGAAAKPFKEDHQRWQLENTIEKGVRRALK